LSATLIKQFLVDKSQQVYGLKRRLAALFSVISAAPLAAHVELRAYLEGATALEIGGPSRVFGRFGLLPVYHLAGRVDNCNFASDTMWKREIRAGATYKFSKGRAVGQQYIAEATSLPFIEPSSYDLVLSSHTLEHIANPLRALQGLIRILRDNGLLVIVLPHRDGTFDHRRPVTTIEHLIEDLNNDTGEEDLAHLEEILALHDLARDPRAGNFTAFANRSRKNLENRCLHHHVFDTRLAVEVVHCVGLQILAVEVVRPYHIFVIARKQRAGDKLDNERFRGIGSAPVWTSPFPSDWLVVGDRFCCGNAKPSTLKFGLDCQ
jgi:SAM-dependent methyltransferase